MESYEHSAQIPVNSLVTPLVSRRGVLRSTAAAGILAAFGFAGSGTLAATKKNKKAATTTKPKSKTTVASPTTVPTAPKTTNPASTGAKFAATDEMVISWTFATSGGGFVHNPFVGVWVEDADGVPVNVIHLEYQIGRGRRWLPDLKRWSRADDALVALGKTSLADTTTNATRVPGSYSVTWNGKNFDGDFVPNGKYNVFIEAAREKGTYQFVSMEANVGNFSAQTAKSGELTSAKIDIRGKA